MKRTIIAFNGPIKSGKSTIAALLYRNLANAMIIPFASTAKKCVEDITGVAMDERQPDGSYDYSQRIKEKTLPSGMQLGRFVMEFAEAVRAIDRKIWADAAIRYILENKRDYYIMPDMRFDEEAQLLLELSESDDYDVVFVRIDPSSDLARVNAISDGRDPNHLGEKKLESIEFNLNYINKLGKDNCHKIAGYISEEVRCF